MNSSYGSFILSPNSHMSTFVKIDGPRRVKSRHRHCDGRRLQCSIIIDLVGDYTRI
jgi:hypothetical protein